MNSLSLPHPHAQLSLPQSGSLLWVSGEVGSPIQDFKSKNQRHFLNLKFFPATSSGGLKHLNNIAAPYAHLDLKFIPLGGVKQANMMDWIESDLVGAIGGSWLAPRDRIANQDWVTIKRNAKKARQSLG